ALCFFIDRFLRLLFICKSHDLRPVSVFGSNKRLTETKRMSNVHVKPSSLSTKEGGIAAWLQNYFNLQENGTSVRQEVMEGVTTFLAIMYSVFVIPGMLRQAEYDRATVFLAVCLTSAIGSMVMGS